MMIEPDKQPPCSHLYHVGRALVRAKAEAAPLDLSWGDLLSRTEINPFIARRAIEFYARMETLGESEKGAVMRMPIIQAMLRLRIMKPPGSSDVDHPG